MTTTILKNKISEAVNEINDEIFLEALLAFVNEHNEKVESNIQISEEDWQVAEDRRKAYLSGNAKTITVNEMKKRFKNKFDK